MKFCGKIIVVNDEATLIFGRSVSNKWISVAFGALQLMISGCSLAQHVYSLYEYRSIFNCHHNATFRHDIGRVLAYDIIIFDYGLFNFLLGTQECVANYLDGGYMRSVWCISHIGALLLMCYGLIGRRRHSIWLWPILLMQSIYALGLIILALATLPKLLYAVANRLTSQFITLATIYFSGMIVNWLFTFAIWHYHWYLQSELKRLKDNAPVSI